MPTRVLFATNRNQKPGVVANDFGTDFNPNHATVFGVCDVGAVSDESEIGNSNLSIDRLTIYNWLPDLRAGVTAGNADHLLVYVHGFDYEFREAMMRAAFLAEWFAGGPAGIRSAAVAFSWPSLGAAALSAYPVDYESATRSGGAFREFMAALVPLIQRFRAAKPHARVTLMAHSMGNHALRAGLAASFDGPTPVVDPAALGRKLYDSILLLASDEDADALPRGTGFDVLEALADRIHVYFNQQDIALKISFSVHKVRRLGHCGAPDRNALRGRPFAFVNCSAANPRNAQGERLDMQWHQYYRLVPAVRDDIAAVMAGRGDDALANRTRYEDENFWRIDQPPFDGWGV